MSQRLLFHIDDPGRWPLLYGNLRNAQAADPGVSLQVVANVSAPVAVWAMGRWREDCEALARGGVDFAFCRNSLNALGLNPDFLPAGTRIVAAGVLALAHAQQHGWSYLKP